MYCNIFLEGLSRTFGSVNVRKNGGRMRSGGEVYDPNTNFVDRKLFFRSESGFVIISDADQDPCLDLACF
jgi:hypothetical protein